MSEVLAEVALSGLWPGLVVKLLASFLLGLVARDLFERWRRWERGVDLELVGTFRVEPVGHGDWPSSWDTVSVPPPENITISPPENWTIQPPDPYSSSLSDAIRPMLERRDAG